jgi:hypothetical protein
LGLNWTLGRRFIVVIDDCNYYVRCLVGWD